MGSNSWLAIDVGTAPTLRAQELRFAWERFFRLGRATTRSDPDDRPRADRRLVAALARGRRRPDRPPARAGRRRRGRDARALARSTRSARAAPLIHECLAAIADEAGYLIVVTDADGMLLSDRGQRAPCAARRRAHELRRGHAVERARRGHERDRHRDRRRPRRPGLRPRALQRGRAALDVLGRADPRPRHRRAARRHRPHRRLLDRPPAQPRRGDRDRAGGRGVAAARAAGARRAPARALRRPRRRGARTRARWSTPTGRPITAVPARAGAPAGRLAIPPGGGAPDAAVRRRSRSPSPVGPGRRGVRRARAARLAARGRRPPAASSSPCSAATARCSRSTAAATELRPRLAEILALLCARPEGMSAEALCADLHGDGGSPSSVRVEVSRLRKLLGPWIDTERYRLTCDVETDVRRVEGLLRAGRRARGGRGLHRPAAARLRGAGHRRRARAARRAGCARR